MFRPKQETEQEYLRQRKIVFDSPRDGNREIYVIHSDGSHQQRLTLTPGKGKFSWLLACSPDGKQILATFSRKNGTGQIVLVAVADGSVQVLKSPFHGPDIYNFKMSFSPDGRFIVYNVPQKDSYANDIVLLRSDGSREIPLVQHPANDILLGWEPDGNRVLFASDRLRCLQTSSSGLSSGA